MNTGRASELHEEPPELTAGPGRGTIWADLRAVREETKAVPGPSFTLSLTQGSALQGLPRDVLATETPVPPRPDIHLHWSSVYASLARPEAPFPSLPPSPGWGSRTFPSMTRLRPSPGGARESGEGSETH